MMKNTLNTLIIQKAEARGEINGVKICINAPTTSHLLFALF